MAICSNRKKTKVSDGTRLTMSKPDQKHSLSVTIIAQDEADRIATCLSSVKSVADEIIVLDSGSADETVEIAKRFTLQVHETDWPGYGPQKQRALEMAKGEWVLSIDADEALTPELQDEISALLRQDPPEIAFCLPWAVTTFGKRLDYGRSARAPLRLFRRQGTRFSNDQVHEKVILPPGKIGRLSGRLLHYTHRDFGHYLNKNAKYAWLGAQKRYQAGKKGQGLTGAVFRAFWVFIQIYFIRRGFMDGRVGFLVAVLYSQGAFNKYAGLWTLRREKLMEKNRN
jgi:glycosyltransferase involved in cell wall biosynthesis